MPNVSKVIKLECKKVELKFRNLHSNCSRFICKKQLIMESRSIPSQ